MKSFALAFALALTAVSAAPANSSDRLDKAFRALLERSGMDLTLEEAASFKKRFNSVLTAKGEQFFDDEMILMETFDDQRPAIYEAEMKSLNPETWTPSMNEGFKNLTWGEARRLLGAKDVTDEDIEKEYREYLHAMMNNPNNPKSCGKTVPVDTRQYDLVQYDDVDPTLPENFDAREKWPMCDSISTIRDQSACGSCWAVSAASVASDRLCISTNGKFNKPISGQFVTSCYDEYPDGCNGGDPGNAFTLMGYYGAPTGGEYHSRGTGQTCYPYDVAPDLEKQVSTPQCAKKCTDGKYPIPMQTDIRTINPNKPIRMLGVEAMKREIFHNGSIVVAFKVSKDIFYYDSNEVYTPSVPYELKYGHAVRVVGWGKENDMDYWIVTNSWGTRNNGGVIKFRMGYSEIEAKVSALPFDRQASAFLA